MELVVFLTFVVTILWLIIGWRAMKAHEQIADAMNEWKHNLRMERGEKVRQQQPDPPIYKGWRPRSQQDDD